jgi:hypothetical protein
MEGDAGPDGARHHMPRRPHRQYQRRRQQHDEAHAKGPSAQRHLAQRPDILGERPLQPAEDQAGDVPGDRQGGDGDEGSLVQREARHRPGPGAEGGTHR